MNVKKFNEYYMPRPMAPIEEQKFPCTFWFITDETTARRRSEGKPVGISPNGIPKQCENQSDLDDAISTYVVGGDYYGQTIAATTITKGRNYGEY